MKPASPVAAEIALLLPRLRYVANHLCKQRQGAEDLVQETAARALANLHLFEPGTHLMGWLVTIMRNEFYSGWRKTRREIQDEDGGHAAKLWVAPAQYGHLELLELRDAMDRLPLDLQRALVMIAEWGMSYNEAAGVAGCAIGTMKSRVNRARLRLRLGDLVCA